MKKNNGNKSALSKDSFPVIPVKTGIRKVKERILDSGFRRNDSLNQALDGVRFQKAKLIRIMNKLTGGWGSINMI